ncbi:MAG TPA: hypothetical protein VHE35_00765 [Kofleriaceae bacterium]|nr:hypothetical protein [Kofleriaceae bacterium]
MMKSKLALALTVLSSLAFAGTALADTNHGRDGRDDRPTLIDHRMPAPAPAPVYVQAPPVVIQQPAALVFQHGPIVASHWNLLANAATSRRGSFTINVPGRASYDQLRLVASQAGLDIQSVQLNYARGRSELVRPANDGLVNLDLGRGKLKSITVKYTSHGFTRGASIKVMAKDGGPAGFHR